MTKGILLIALGYDVYGSYAYNLALSLKANNNHIRVCLLYEPSAVSKLTETELSFFDDMILIPAEEYKNGQYHRAKLLAHKYTPFDYTVYMDVDTIWIPNKNPEDLVNSYLDAEFTIGLNGHYDVIGQRIFSKAPRGYTWWGQPGDMAKYFGIKNVVPQTVSGYFAFYKSDYCKDIFDKALMAYDDENAPAIRWAGGKADEYCFNVALGLIDYDQLTARELFYFDKLNGEMETSEIYNKFWGIAMGGHKVSQNLIILYNKLIGIYSEAMKMDNRHYFVNKATVIPDRKTF